MKQLSGIKVFLFGFLCYVAMTVFLTLFFGFEQWSREFKFIFMIAVQPFVEFGSNALSRSTLHKGADRAVPFTSRSFEDAIDIRS